MDGMMGPLHSFKPYFFRIGWWHMSHMEGLRLKSWASKTEMMYSAIESLLLKGRNNECICKTLQSKFLIYENFCLMHLLFPRAFSQQLQFVRCRLPKGQIWYNKLRTTYLKLKIIQKTSIWCLEQARWGWLKCENFSDACHEGKLLIKPLMVKGH